MADLRPKSLLEKARIIKLGPLHLMKDALEALHPESEDLSWLKDFLRPLPSAEQAIQATPEAYKNWEKTWMGDKGILMRRMRDPVISKYILDMLGPPTPEERRFELVSILRQDKKTLSPEMLAVTEEADKAQKYWIEYAKKVQRQKKP